MYDCHIYCKEYNDLKSVLVSALYEDAEVDIEQIEARVQELYDNGEIQGRHYDELMGYIIDLR